MKFQSKLIKLLPIQTGTSKNGDWKKQDIIVETDDQYPKKVCISIWGNKIDENILKEGNTLDISINIESKEYNNSWYTDIKAWKIELVDGDSSIDSNTKFPDITGDVEGGDGGLPF